MKVRIEFKRPGTNSAIILHYGKLKYYTGEKGNKKVPTKVSRMIDMINEMAANYRIAGKDLTSSLIRARLDAAFRPGRSRQMLLSMYFDSLQEMCKGKLGAGTLKQYKVVAAKVDPMACFSDVSVAWLEKFERNIQDLDINTINTNMKRLLSMLSKAVKAGHLIPDQIAGYKPPAYTQKLVEYLNEKELTALTKVVKAQTAKGKKIAGYYFLLSCFTGWRISDVKRFDKKMIHGNNLVLRAKKNGQIVSMPIIPRLKEVLNFVTKNPFDISEQKVREYVKELCDFAGIKKVKFHGSRHTFAMLLMAKGFTRDEVAELIGDSVLIAKVYARIHNESLHEKIRQKLG